MKLPPVGGASLSPAVLIQQGDPCKSQDSVGEIGTGICVGQCQLKEGLSLSEDEFVAGLKTRLNALKKSTYTPQLHFA